MGAPVMIHRHSALSAQAICSLLVTASDAPSMWPSSRMMRCQCTCSNTATLQHSSVFRVFEWRCTGPVRAQQGVLSKKLTGTSHICFMLRVAICCCILLHDGYIANAVNDALNH